MIEKERGFDFHEDLLALWRLDLTTRRLLMLDRKQNFQTPEKFPSKGTSEKFNKTMLGDDLQSS